MADTGVSSTEINQLLGDMGRTVSYQVCTKTTDPITGDESESYATATNVTAVFFREDTRFIFDKEGLLDAGDAYLIANPSTNAKRYDKFTIDSETYYIEKVVERYVGGVHMQTFCTCFKVA